VVVVAAVVKAEVSVAIAAAAAVGVAIVVWQLSPLFSSCTLHATLKLPPTTISVLQDYVI
jgi:hypothetical protein